MNELVTRKRNVFVSIWLWLMMLSYLFIAVVNIYGIFVWKNLNMEETLSVISVIVFAHILSIISVMFLLRWKKIGFWALCTSHIIGAFAWYFFFISVPQINIFTISTSTAIAIFPIVHWAILQIKKEGVSCWKNLK